MPKELYRGFLTVVFEDDDGGVFQKRLRTIVYDRDSVPVDDGEFCGFVYRFARICPVFDLLSAIVPYERMNVWNNIGGFEAAIANADCKPHRWFTVHETTTIGEVLREIGAEPEGTTWMVRAY